MLLQWLLVLSIISLALSDACAIAIAIDEYRPPQKMWIMNLVWPMTAQVAMLCGFLTSYRVNIRLVPSRIKERM